MQFNPGTSPLTQLIGESATLWVINFEVERFWSNVNPKHILGPSFPSGLVHLVAPEQHVLCVSRPQDIIVLRNQPDPGLFQYLKSLGLGQGHVYSIESSSTHWNESLSQCVLRQPEHISSLRALVKKNQVKYLTPFGATVADSSLAKELGLSLSCAEATTSERVNSKIFSHEINHAASYSAIPGNIATTITELREYGTSFLGQGEILIKDPMGVSGKGIKRISSSIELENYIQYLEKRQFSKFELLVESLLDKTMDFNAQLIVKKNGEVVPLIIKTAITKDGKHLGHVSGVDLPTETSECIHNASLYIGQKLYAKEFYGIAGHDAIQTRDGNIYPNLEINARLNQSSLQWTLDQGLQCNNYFWFGFIEIETDSKLSFSRAIKILDDGSLLFTAEQPRGFLPINSFSFDHQSGEKMRLYGAYYFNRFENLSHELEQIGNLFHTKERK